ncbi:hypothetical protein GCM10018962_29620 [Dactylosporangium matsuzakiense]|uniref:Uncharacterized protein n=1 Tax=Dactylosporangium matsuzakiense TaxID=53360 RepID=A0A9W6NQ83_9ACTN|nr:hypothetical protein GCM10017581_067530 [Dactylosporangium matsuzakiense]
MVGLPGLSPIAAAEMGIALERLALVPHPGAEWTTIVAALLDGFDIVVAAAPKNIAPAVAGRLAARARQRGSVLVPAGAWAGADLTLAPVRGAWGGLGAGRGRLRHRELTVQARGRGAASAAREVTLELPAITGVLPPIQVPSTQAPPIYGPSTQAPPIYGPSTQAPPLHGLSIQGPTTPTPAAHGPAGAGHGPATHESRSEETPEPLRKVG